jgi:SAM-dependent methyltransferase
MIALLRSFILISLTFSVLAIQAAGAGSKPQRRAKYTKGDAERMVGAAEGTLAPVYAPLAEEIAEKLALHGRQGVGIDVGSGPGTLILELCRRTEMHWVNADINPHFFPYFFEKAQGAGLSGRVSALRANACALPFRDGYADVVVSRGSFHFWPDLEKGLAEIYRVLKPDGVAYIGRGFPERLPLDVAARVRSKQGKGMKYDVDETEHQFRAIMESLQIDYRIHRPKKDNGENVNYGLWLQFHKPQ